MNIWRVISSLEFFDTRIYQYQGADANRLLSSPPPRLMQFPGTLDYVARLDGGQWIVYDYRQPPNNVIGLDVYVEACPDDFGEAYRMLVAPRPHVLLSDNVGQLYSWRIGFFDNSLWVIMTEPSIGRRRDVHCIRQMNELFGTDHRMRIRWRWDSSGTSMLYLNDRLVESKSGVYPGLMMPIPTLHVGGGRFILGSRLAWRFRGYIKKVKVAVLTKEMRDTALGIGLSYLPLQLAQLIDDKKLSRWFSDFQKLENDARKMLTKYLPQSEEGPLKSQLEKVVSRLVTFPRKDAKEEYQERVKMVADFLKELSNKNPREFTEDLRNLVDQARRLGNAPYLGDRVPPLHPEAQDFLARLGEEFKKLCESGK